MMAAIPTSKSSYWSPGFRVERLLIWHCFCNKNRKGSTGLKTNSVLDGALQRAPSLSSLSCLLISLNNVMGGKCLLNLGTAL